MDIKQLKDLISFIDKQTSNIGEVSIEVEKKYKVIIKQQISGILAQTVSPPATFTADIPSTIHPAVSAHSVADTKTPDSKETNTVIIKSPMIGTFYRKPSPSKPNFVEVGDVIEKGKVVCIIEAMKLFNNIESEVSGRIVKILVNDSSPVEFGQPLFAVEPL